MDWKISMIKNDETTSLRDGVDYNSGTFARDLIIHSLLVDLASVEELIGDNAGEDYDRKLRKALRRVLRHYMSGDEATRYGVA